MATEAPYEVLLSRGARRTLDETLPRGAAFAAYEFIYGPLADNPRRLGAPLKAPFEGFYRARRGEYRIRYRIDDAGRRIFVHDVDHRRDAYHS